MAMPAQPRHLLCQDPDIAAIPTVANYQDNRSSTKHPPCPVVVEGMQRFANAGPTGPVLDNFGDILYGGIYIPPRQLASNTGKTCGKDERLYVGEPIGDRMDKVKE
jgi:hypothetical protein